MGGDRSKELGFLGDGDGDTDIVMEKTPEASAVEILEAANLSSSTEPVAENKAEPQQTEASNG